MTMSRADMLQKIGISDADFTDYLAKHNNFMNGLNSDQKKFHSKNHQFPLDKIAASLGPTATPADVQQLFDGAVQPATMSASISCCKTG